MYTEGSGAFSGQSQAEWTRPQSQAASSSAFSAHQIRPDIRLLVQNRDWVDEPLQFDYRADESPVQFFYCLSGKARISIARPDGSVVTGQVAARNYAVSYVPGAVSTCISKRKTNLQVIALLVQPESLQKLMCREQGSCQQSCASSCRSCVRNLVAGVVQQAFHQEDILPLPLEMTLKQIFDCPALSALAPVFLEYKTMELLYNQLSLFDSSEEEAQKQITPAELGAAQRAYDILLHDLASPPSLLNLAKTVGLTHTRLNHIFRLLHHDTVFGVLRGKRLECARKLLEDNRKSVTEVAYECGFATPSHFSRSFLGRYGVQPKRYQSGFAASQLS